MPLLRGGRGSPGRVALLYGVLTALALAGPLTACSDATPTPGPLPSTSAGDPTHATPSDDPTPSTPDAAPTMPDAAHGTSAKAAKAFVRYYVSLVNFASRTGRTSQLRKAESKSCGACKSVLKQINSVYDAGGHIRTHGWAIKRIATVANRGEGRSVSALIQLSPQVVSSPSGTPKHFDGGAMTATFALRVKGTTWTIVNWERAA